MDSTLSFFVHSKVLTLTEVEEYLREFVGCVVVEVDSLCETALQSRVRIDKVMHVVSITSNNTNELATIILQTLEQGIDSFSAKRILIIRLQCIGLIDEQHTTHSRINQLVGLDGSLTSKTCNQLRTVCLYQLST